MKGTITVRIHLSTYNRLRKNFKALRGETVIGYFERLSKWVDEYGPENDKA